MPANTRYRVTNLKLAEISTVDRPAQSGATCVLIKSAASTVKPEEVSFETVRKSASAVERGVKPAYPRVAYEDAMILRAEELAKSEGITPEHALAKHYRADPTLRALAHAAEVAGYNEHATRVGGQAA